MGGEIDLTRVTLAILAGGESARMGKSKAALEIHGRPILAFLLDQFDWPGPTLLVTAPGRENPPAWERFDRHVVDPVAIGPLGGVYTALQNVTTELLASTTVDMPVIGKAHLEWMLSQLRQRAVMLQRTVNGSMQIEPFPFVCKGDMAPVVAEQIAAGNRSVRGLAKLTEVDVVTAPGDWPSGVWTNLNTPGEYRAFVERPL